MTTPGVLFTHPTSPAGRECARKLDAVLSELLSESEWGGSPNGAAAIPTGNPDAVPFARPATGPALRLVETKPKEKESV